MKYRKIGTIRLACSRDNVKEKYVSKKLRTYREEGVSLCVSREIQNKKKESGRCLGEGNVIRFTHLYFVIEVHLTFKLDEKLMRTLCVGLAKAIIRISCAEMSFRANIKKKKKNARSSHIESLSVLYIHRDTYGSMNIYYITLK